MPLALLGARSSTSTVELLQPHNCVKGFQHLPCKIILSLVPLKLEISLRSLKRGFPQASPNMSPETPHSAQMFVNRPAGMSLTVFPSWPCQKTALNTQKPPECASFQTWGNQVIEAMPKAAWGIVGTGVWRRGKGQYPASVRKCLLFKGSVVHQTRGLCILWSSKLWPASLGSPPKSANVNLGRPCLCMHGSRPLLCHTMLI